jgi:hypothetical protein
MLAFLFPQLFPWTGQGAKAIGLFHVTCFMSIGGLGGRQS